MDFSHDMLLLPLLLHSAARCYVLQKSDLGFRQAKSCKTEFVVVAQKLLKNNQKNLNVLQCYIHRPQHNTICRNIFRGQKNIRHSNVTMYI